MKSPILFSNVYKAYGNQPVLQKFSACFLPGEAIVLMGASGSGKTTLARLLLGLEKPDAGAITGREGVRFSCVFQEDRLCPGFSAVDNIALVLPRAKREGIASSLAEVGLLERDIHKPVWELSGGQKRRVALVRAVAADSEMLLLDEAFKGMDPETREKAFGYVKRNRAGRALLVVAHEEAEAVAFGPKRLLLPQGGETKS